MPGKLYRPNYTLWGRFYSEKLGHAKCYERAFLGVTGPGKRPWGSKEKKRRCLEACLLSQQPALATPSGTGCPGCPTQADLTGADRSPEAQLCSSFSLSSGSLGSSGTFGRTRPLPKAQHLSFPRTPPPPPQGPLFHPPPSHSEPEL